MTPARGRDNRYGWQQDFSTHVVVVVVVFRIMIAVWLQIGMREFVVRGFLGVFQFQLPN